MESPKPGFAFSLLAVCGILTTSFSLTYGLSWTASRARFAELAPINLQRRPHLRYRLGTC